MKLKRLVTFMVASVLILAVLAVGASARRRHCERPKWSNASMQRVTDGEEVDPMLYLPDYVDVVVSVPFADLDSDPADPQSTPISAVAHYVGAHALAILPSMCKDSPGGESITRNSPMDSAAPPRSLGDPIRIIVALWEKGADTKDHTHGLDQWNGWDGVVVFVMKDETSVGMLLGDIGLTSKVKGCSHVLMSKSASKGDSSETLYACVLSKRVCVVGSSLSGVQSVVARSNHEDLLIRSDCWKPYQPEGDDSSFWVARRSGERIGPLRHKVGFGAAPGPHQSSFRFTYVFANGHVPDRFEAAAELKDEGRPPLWITDYGAPIRISEMTESRLTCEISLDEGRALESTVVTILNNLGIVAFGADDKSP